MAPTVILIGFMGTGKSAVGSCLARGLGWNFFDADIQIEKRMGMPVAEVFEKHGEETFRTAEAAVVTGLLDEAASSREGTVISLGGGAVTAPETARRLRREPLGSPRTPPRSVRTPYVFRSLPGPQTGRLLLSLHPVCSPRLPFYRPCLVVTAPSTLLPVRSGKPGPPPALSGPGHSGPGSVLGITGYYQPLFFQMAASPAAVGRNCPLPAHRRRICHSGIY